MPIHQMLVWPYNPDSMFNVGDLYITQTFLNITLVDIIKFYRPDYDGITPVKGNIINVVDNIIGGQVDGAYSLTCNLPAESSATFQNLGYIVGKGGRGSNDNGAPTAGSHAILVQLPTILDNLGIIGSGGGGGGQAYYASGGGGAGHTPGEGGIGAASGQPGTLLTGGIGGTGYGKKGRGTGGTGGALGQRGNNGSWDTGGSLAGAIAGNAIVNAQLITWKTYGDIRGSVIYQ